MSPATVGVSLAPAVTESSIVVRGSTIVTGQTSRETLAFVDCTSLFCRHKGVNY